MQPVLIESRVLLSLACDDKDEIEVSAQIFVDLEIEGEPRNFSGQVGFTHLSVRRDPTRALIEVALGQREVGLGPLLGDLRRAGLDLTRFELYSAPFRIELSPSLRQRLAGSWDERDPR